MCQIYMSDLMEMNFHIECVFSIPRLDYDDNRKTLLCGKKIPKNGLVKIPADYEMVLSVCSKNCQFSVKYQHNL